MPMALLPSAPLLVTEVVSDLPLTSVPLFPLSSNSFPAIRLPAESISARPFQALWLSLLPRTTLPGELRTSAPSD